MESRQARHEEQHGRIQQQATQHGEQTTPAVEFWAGHRSISVTSRPSPAFTELCSKCGFIPNYAASADMPARRSHPDPPAEPAPPAQPLARALARQRRALPPLLLAAGE